MGSRLLRGAVLASCLLAATAVVAQPVTPRGKVGFPAAKAPGEGGPGNFKMQLMLARGHVESGRVRMAIQTLRGILEARPHHLQARLSLLEALAEVGMCADADAEYQEIQGTTRDHTRARAALGKCAEAVGDLEAAIIYYRQAADLDPYGADHRYALADLLSRMGRLEEAAEQRLQLFGADRGPGYAFVAEARERFRLDDPDYAGVLQQAKPFSFLQPVRRAIAILEVVEGIDADCDPEASYRVALVNPEAAAISAECSRRAGDAEEAIERLQLPGIRMHERGPTLSPILARAVADLGDLDRAELVLAGAPNTLAPVLASRWYVARLRGDEAGAGHWEALYLAHPEGAVHPLQDLIPAG